MSAVGGQRPVERMDAARNRARVLDAASRLFAEHGVDAVTMDQIAEAASVGKGTLYRRFGDKASLALALLDARERAFQSAILSGPPPLGPGAAPVERAVAFLRESTNMAVANRDIRFCAETAAPGARFRHAVYSSYRSHLAMLIRSVGGVIDAEILAEVLIAPLAAELIRHLGDDVGADGVRLADVLEHVARGALTPRRTTS